MIKETNHQFLVMVNITRPALKCVVWLFLKSVKRMSSGWAFDRKPALQMEFECLDMFKRVSEEDILQRFCHSRIFFSVSPFHAALSSATRD